MKNALKTTLGALAFAAGMMLAGAASAATLSFTGTGQIKSNLQNNDLGVGGLNGTNLDFISGNLKTASNGLGIVGTGPFKITFTYLGKEAGNTNFSIYSGGATLFTGSTAVNTTTIAYQALAGLIDFGFKTTAPNSAIGTISNNGGANPNSSNYAIGYRLLSSTSALVLFDDIASSDRDFDDHGVRIDITAVPLPAGGLLLLTALGGLTAVRRRKTA